MRTIGILGATGSIGTQALDIVRRHPEAFRASVLTAHGRAEQLFDAVRAFRPDAAGLVVEPDEIPEDLKDVAWYFGPDCSRRALEAVRPDDALCAVVGIAGLDSVLTAMACCKRVLLANKEALVTGGALVLEAARRRGVPLLPVDSEHSAIFQCLQAAQGNAAARLILTASGGALRTWGKNRIEAAGVGDVLAHPTWAMGPKITVDCATMMNKGLEVIEAHYLFGQPVDQIDVVVHPESIIHSMVEFEDGAVLAQLGAPDMRTAIGYAMGYPARVAYGGARLDFAKMGKLTFEEPDLTRFPCLGYAMESIKTGGSMPVALNGANEAAVRAFLQGRLRFGGIANAVDRALQALERTQIACVDDIYAVDRAAQAFVTDHIAL